MSNEGNQDSDNDINDDFDEDEEWKKFDGFGDEDETEYPYEFYVREVLTENDCGFTFRWKNADDVPLDKMLNLAFKCNTP